MIIQLSKWEVIDTADLTSEERHILQKLILWESSVASLAEFREKTIAAMEAGWGDSGPVDRSRNLDRIIHYLEGRVALRLKGESTQKEDDE